MQLIIEMPDEAYNELLKEQHLPSGLDVEYFIIHGTPLKEELEEIKAEINEYLIASFADDEDFRWFNLCLDSHISRLKGKNNG